MNIDNKFKLNSWSDWFENCNWLRPKLDNYEKLMGKYYSLQCSKTDIGRQKARELYLRKHDKQFFANDPVMPMWFIKKLIKIGLILFIVFFILMFAISFIGNIFASTEMVKRVVMVALISLCLSFFSIGIPALAHKLRIGKICKQLTSIENEISTRIACIPPKYRNSQACDDLYDVYASYNIDSFQRAIAATDEHLVSNGLDGAYLACLFDVPYNNKDLISDARQGSKEVDKNSVDTDVLQDPNLPTDILNKTFTGVDNADRRLNELVGLSKVKDQVRQMKNRISYYGDSTHEKLSGNHMVFLGPPGTGKTTVARIITKMLYDFGYIRENKCVEIDGGYLKSQYVGQTSGRTNAIVNYSLGGVLFIDEAYTLLDGKGSSNSVGSEAIGVLLKAMEDHRDDLVVIMAGYEDDMNRLLSVNEGFSSRIKYKIYFDNFTVDELVTIFRRQMRSSGVALGVQYKIEKSALGLIETQLEKESKIVGFGNARVVRNIWDKLLDIHADNYMNSGLDETRKYIITKQDVKQLVTDREEQMQEDGRNFIAKRNLDSTVVSLQELKSKTKNGSENPDLDLSRLTGLDVVKDEINHMKAIFEFYNGDMDTDSRHMMFLGPPGTGKTTVASIMTGYLYKMGIIAENKYLDINGDFLRGMYTGHTGKRTEAVVQYSQGMVLFIDEAYLLAGQKGESNSFGQEALGVLLDAMEKHRKNFVVILAGYEDEMKDLLEMNSGLKSRIPLTFHFEPYTPKELCKMMLRMAKQQGFTIDKDVWEILQKHLVQELRNPKFGNGRYIRMFWDAVKKTHIFRYSQGECDESQKYIISAEDVIQPIESQATAHL